MPAAIMAASMLKRMLRYDDLTGKLFWVEREASTFPDKPGRTAKHRCALWNSKFAGKEAATSLDVGGYARTRINGVGYQAHRIVWALMFGDWPGGQIDHINGDRRDNRISNLRDVTSAENRKNVATRRESATGVCGVERLPSGSFRAYIGGPKGGKSHLGCFVSLGAANAARKQAERDLGYHPNNGRPSSLTERASANG